MSRAHLAEKRRGVFHRVGKEIIKCKGMRTKGERAWECVKGYNNSFGMQWGMSDYGERHTAK